MSALLLGIALVVGALIGTVGVGGILLIPALAALAGLSTHAAMGTALFSFIFTGLLGTWLYQRHGSIDWSVTIPVCLGALAGGYPGSLANAAASGRVLDLLLGAVIIFAGLYALFPARRALLSFPAAGAPRALALLFLGAAVGFGSGLTGVGGPVLSVPLMVICGFAPLTAIATSQVIQITAALSGSAGNLSHGFVALDAALWVTLAELAGVVLGAFLAHRVSQVTLKRLIAVVCIVVGGFIVCRALLGA